MNDAHSSPTGLIIRKRDGTAESFSRAKMVACLMRPLHETCDADPPATAEALAESVLQHLEQAQINAAIPSVRLREFVEAVLSQTGYLQAADALKHHARLREQQRRQIHVAYFHERRGTFVHRRWSKSAVVANLRTEHDLESCVARCVAGVVESAVLRCGLKVVTTGLIDQMIQSELLAWGLLPTVLRVSNRVRPSATQPQSARGAGKRP